MTITTRHAEARWDAWDAEGRERGARGGGAPRGKARGAGGGVHRAPEAWHTWAPMAVARMRA